MGLLVAISHARERSRSLVLCPHRWASMRARLSRVMGLRGAVPIIPACFPARRGPENAGYFNVAFSSCRLAVRAGLDVAPAARSFSSNSRPRDAGGPTPRPEALELSSCVTTLRRQPRAGRPSMSLPLPEHVLALRVSAGVSGNAGACGRTQPGTRRRLAPRGVTHQPALHTPRIPSLESIGSSASRPRREQTSPHRAFHGVDSLGRGRHSRRVFGSASSATAVGGDRFKAGRVGSSCASSPTARLARGV